MMCEISWISHRRGKILRYLTIPDSLTIRRCNSMRLLLFLRIPSFNGNEYNYITVDTIMQCIGFVCSTELGNMSSAAVT